MSRPRKYPDRFDLTLKEREIIRNSKNKQKALIPLNDDEKRILAKHAAWVRRERGYSNITDLKAQKLLVNKVINLKSRRYANNYLIKPVKPPLCIINLKRDYKRKQKRGHHCLIKPNERRANSRYANYLNHLKKYHEQQDLKKKLTT